MTEERFAQQQFVTILGRPNVGKSTLFNRLVGGDRSITGEQSGLTRDRISETLQWNDNRLTLIDTAGYPTSTNSPDEDFTLEQVDSMIERSHCLLFLVDARTGLTELDKTIARKLYPVSDRVLLVVNKVDDATRDDQVKSDFYELGLEEVVSISAQHSRNLGEIKDWVSQQLEGGSGGSTPASDPETIQLSLVGRPNVGKSTLFNTILGYDRAMVSDEPGTTRDYVSVEFDVEDRRFQLLDTGGLMRKKNMREPLEREIVYGSLEAINSSDVVCLMLDWNERVTRQDQKIAGLIQDRYRGCMILVNKADEVDPDNEENWLAHLNDRLYFLDYAPVLFTSGRTERGLRAIFRTGIEIHEEMSKLFDSEELTNAFLDLKSELSWPSHQAGEVILRTIQQTDTDPLTFEIQADRPDRLTTNDIRYLSGTLREKLSIKKSPVKLTLAQDDLNDS